MKTLKHIFAVLSFLVFLYAAFVAFSFFGYRVPQTTVLLFPEGTPLRTIARELAGAKLITHPLLFEGVIRLTGKEREIRAGEYEFVKGLRALEILSMMVEGKVRLYALTIPEGLTLREIGALAVAKGIGTSEEWERLTTNSAFLSSLGVEASSLEGYLFPDTYLFDRTTMLEKLVRQMSMLFFQKIPPPLVSEVQSRGLNLHQWVTLASLVEKETAVPSERPLIASVFLNRLKRSMPLQTDPSVIYGIKDFDGNLTRKHLETDHPYNTYTRTGLPPGPICSPGLESMMAVLRPEKSDYLYFVSRNDGTHQFSKTLEDHGRAVQVYQRKGGESR